MRRARTFPWILILTVTLFAGSCAQPAPPPPAPAKPDLAAEEQLIRAADRAWLKAAQAKDPAAEVAVLAPDAMIVRPNNAPMNRAEFQAFQTKDYAANPKIVPDWTTDMIRVADSADWAVQTGHYTSSGLGPKGDGTDNGRFVTIWKKVSGSWKVASDTSVSTQPVADKK